MFAKACSAVLLVTSLVLATSPTFALDSDKAAKFYEDGLARFKKNDMDGAIIQLKNALQQDQKLLAAHVLLGRAYLRNGNPPAAEIEFNQALTLGVSRAEVAAPLARTYLQLGQPRNVLDKVNADGLPSAAKLEVLTLRGIAFAELGNQAQASQAFETAKALDATSTIPLLAEIPIALTLGQRDRAKALAEKTITLAPNNADAWNMHASIAQANGDIKLALERYSKALQLDAEHVDARVARAGIFLEQQRESDAEKDLVALKKIVPNEARSAYLRAVLAGRRGQTKAVKDELKEISNVVDRLPQSWIATREQFLMLGGVAHHGLGEFAKAKTYLEAVVALNGRNFGARKLLAAIYQNEKDFTAVENTLSPVLRDLPNDAQLLQLMGQLRLAQKRYVQASQFLERALSLGGDTSEVHAAIGFTQLNLGQNTAGVKNLEVAFQKKSSDAQVGLSLAMEYIAQKQGAKAIAVVDALVKAEPENLATRNMQGAIYAAAGNKVGARKAYEQVLAKDALFAPAVLNLAKLDLADGKTDAARARLNALLGRAKDDDNAMYEMGQLELLARQPVVALRWFEQAFGQRRTNVRAGLAAVDLLLAQKETARALQTAREMVDSNPKNLEAISAFARVQMANGERDKMLLTLKEMTKLAEFDAEVQIRIGRMHLLANSPDAALYNAQKSLTTQPNNLGALSLLGDTELLRRDTNKAEAIAKDITTRYPQSPEGYRIAGDVAVARGTYSAAAQAYRTALERSPTTVNVQRVAHALTLADDYPKAIETLNTWLIKHSDDFGARAALAEVQMRAGNWREARVLFDKVLAQQPENVSLLNNQAIVLMRLNDPGAVNIAERAYKLTPQNSNVIDTYGWLLATTGKLEPALRLLRDARLRQPESPEIRYHLAWVLAKQGRKAEAKDEMQDLFKPGIKFESQEEARAFAKTLGL